MTKQGRPRTGGIMDSAWVEKLYNEQSGNLVRYLKGHTGSQQDAEDIMQDTFLSVDKHKAEFDAARCDEVAWLYIIAKRKLISWYRSRKQDYSLDESPDEADGAFRVFEEPSVSPVDAAVRLMEMREQVAEALSVLDERSRQVVVLKYFNDMNDEEIAARLDTSVSNVRVIRNRAMLKMRGSINDR